MTGLHHRAVGLTSSKVFGMNWQLLARPYWPLLMLDFTEWEQIIVYPGFRFLKRAQRFGMSNVKDVWMCNIFVEYSFIHWLLDLLKGLSVTG